MHKILERQIKKYLAGAPMTPEFKSFLDAIDTAYNNFDEDRKLLDRSVEISSKEFYEINNKLKSNQTELETKISDLQNTRKAVLNLLEDIDIEKQEVEKRLKSAQENWSLKNKN